MVPAVNRRASGPGVTPGLVVSPAPGDGASPVGPSGPSPPAIEEPAGPSDPHPDPPPVPSPPLGDPRGSRGFCGVPVAVEEPAGLSDRPQTTASAVRPQSGRGGQRERERAAASRGVALDDCAGACYQQTWRAAGSWGASCVPASGGLWVAADVATSCRPPINPGPLPRVTRYVPTSIRVGARWGVLDVGIPHGVPPRHEECTGRPPPMRGTPTGVPAMWGYPTGPRDAGSEGGAARFSGAATTADGPRGIPRRAGRHPGGSPACGRLAASSSSGGTSQHRSRHPA